MQISIRRWVIVFLIAWATGKCSGQVPPARSTGQSPLLVELFTSEGCSSCPPADALLEKWDASQPIPGAQMIVLSEHVDYFNHEGWRDPYSSSSVTERQNAYAHEQGTQGGVYTPQFIVDGDAVLHPDNPQQVSQVFQKAVLAPKAPIDISAIRVEPSDPGSLQMHIRADGKSTKHNADIYVAVALDHAASHVLRGENSGRDLSHVAVLQSLTKAGKLKKGGSFDQDLHVKFKPGTDMKNIRILVLLQEGGPGKVLGVAMQKNIEAR